MNTAIVPIVLLCASLGLALAWATPRARVAGLAAFALSAALASAASPPVRWVEPALLTCWIGVAACAAFVLFGRRMVGPVAAALGLAAGLATGLAAAMQERFVDLAAAATLLLLFMPAVWLIRSGRGMAVRVCASWLVAVAVLGAAAPLVSTPGYSPDHME